MPQRAAIVSEPTASISSAPSAACIRDTTQDLLWVTVSEHIVNNEHGGGAHNHRVTKNISLWSG